ncbi:MAG: hypothetical protein Q6364_06200 [Candidatus Hermodarchaeota archaeon]|jgi:hypothetical protein|nr:hypothetical protein [Candidatus Hermodarchaeota archaeon]
MSAKTRKFWKALKCPVCGERAVFFVTMDAVKDATQYPVPFEVIHDDHKFLIYLDSGLLISRIEEAKPPIASTEAKPKAKSKPKAKTKKTKKET